MRGLGRIVSAGVRALVAVLAILFVFLQVSDDSSRPSMSAVAAGDPPVATATRVGGDGRRTRFVADVTQPLGFSVYVIPDPFRVIIDLPEVDFELPAGIGQQGRGLIDSYRYGRFAPGKSRIVLDANAPVLIEKSYVVKAENGQPARLVVDLIRTDRVTFAKIHDRVERAMRAAKAAEEGKPETVAAASGAGDGGPDTAREPEESRQAALEAVPGEPEPLPVSGADGEGAAPRDPAPLPKPRPVIADASDASDAGNTAGTPPEPDGGGGEERADDAAPAGDAPQAGEEATVAAAGSEDGTVSEDAARELERVMGALSSPPPLPPAKPHRDLPDRRVVVIDPGHGGVDPGAISRSGTYEKKVVLAFAKALRDKLAASGHYKVLMTRDDDTFVRLGDRVKFARRNHADLFIAIHADSLRRGNARGATIYTVSERASDREAAELAAKENRADLIAGVDLVEENEEVTGILLDLAQRETKNHSVYFAKTLISEMKAKTRMHGRPHRYAGFRVLRAPDVPSVLVELGYLSSRADEKLLLSAQWRARVAGAMTKAVDAFFGIKVAANR